MHRRKLTFPRLLCLFLLAFPSASHAAEPTDGWPHWSGPLGNLTSTGGGVFQEHPRFALQELWKSPLGSGYSGIAVQGDTVLTGLANGEWDYLAAFHTATGKELWRYRIAKSYIGHDGSDDGPLGTPTIRGDRVYAVGPWGELFALRLDTGEEVWRHQLAEVFGAPKPEYGFSTSPLVVDDQLIVQVGGKEGRSIVAFDLESGKIRWSAGEGAIVYQSPQLLHLADTPQIVAADTAETLGLAPESGEALWRHPHPVGKSEFAHPIPIGENRFLLSYWTETSLLEVGREDQHLTVRQVWNNPSLKGTYNLPAPHGDHLYGYSGRFLVSVDATTGETAWTSREPGGGNLILVDNHLVILTEAGAVVVAEANPEGYREHARLQVLEKECFRAPVFADGRIFVRDLKHLAAVVVKEAPLEAESEKEALAEPGS